MQTWERTFTLAEQAGLSVEQKSGGRVQVTGWDEADVKVTATSESEDLADRLAAKQESGGLQLEVRRAPRGLFGFFRSEPPVDLAIMVPRGTACSVDSGSGAVEIVGTRNSVHVDTGSGDVTVAEVGSASLDTGSGDVQAMVVMGSLEIDTGSGDVEVTKVGGNVKVDVGSGDVEIEQVAGSVEVDTGSGDIELTDVEGSVELDTGSGRVTVRRVRGPEMHIDTGGGSIRAGELDVANLRVDTGSGSAEIELLVVRPADSYEIDTGSGKVTVMVPAAAGITLDLESDSGRIVQEGLNLQVISSERGEMHATLNGGGARLEVDSGSGDIRIIPSRAVPEEGQQG